MGTAIPQPPMRAAERRKKEELLRRHAEFMHHFEADGMSREEASRKAFMMVKAGARPESK